MTEGIMNLDGSRNWQANILLDNIKRLEQEKFALTQESQQKSQTICELEQENKELKSDVLKWQKAFSRQYQINENKGYSKTEENYRSALEEIKNDIMSNKSVCAECIKIAKRINEVLG